MVVSITVMLKASYWMVTTKGYVENTFIHNINNNSNEYEINFNNNINRNKNYDNKYDINNNNNNKNNYNNSDIEQTVTIAASSSSSAASSSSSSATSEELVTDKVTSQEDANEIQLIKSMITPSYVDNDYNNIHDYERQALHDLYISTNGNKWLWHYDGGHWNFTNPYVNPCNDSYSYNLTNYENSNSYNVEYTWQGLTCIYDADLSYYYITSINLGRYSLQGKIPETIGNFKQLIILELQENILTNTIPSTIGNLHELRYLYHSLYHYITITQLMSITISLSLQHSLHNLYDTMNNRQFTRIKIFVFIYKSFNW